MCVCVCVCVCVFGGESCVRGSSLLERNQRKNKQMGSFWSLAECGVDWEKGELVSLGREGIPSRVLGQANLKQLQQFSQMSNQDIRKFQWLKMKYIICWKDVATLSF